MAIRIKNPDMDSRQGRGGVSHFDENLSIPAYNVTQLTLIARDPHWVYAYWDISEDSLKQARAHLQDIFDHSRYVLRMYDVTAIDFNGHNANHSFDIEVDSSSRNWYVNIWSDNVNYCAEIGLRHPDGGFYVLARSNVVATPRESFSNRQDIIWMERNNDDPSQPFVFDLPRTEEQKRLLQKRGIASSDSKKGRASRRYLTEKDIRAYYARMFPRLRRARRRRAIVRAGKRPLHDSITLRDIIGFDAGRKNQLLLEWASRKEYLKKFLLGASAEFVEGGSEQWQGRGSEGASEQLPRNRKFFFELWTELLVYGRTEPDATVHHGSKHIPLREDGTFSLRFALPDATTIPLDFTAESSDRVEKRRIATSGIRSKTEYNP